jgi:hypothetical protein
MSTLILGGEHTILANQLNININTNFLHLQPSIQILLLFTIQLTINWLAFQFLMLFEKNLGWASGNIDR